MHALIAAKRTDLAELCRRFGIVRLEGFGSAARGADFDPANSDIDLLITFGDNADGTLMTFFDVKEAIEAVIGCPVDLVERAEIEASRNYIRRRRILAEAEPVYA